MKPLLARKRLLVIKWFLVTKRLLVLICFIIMAVSLTSAYLCKSTFWQAFLINASTSFLALGVALILVNIYLERNVRKGAVKSLLILSHRAVADFHNTLLKLTWAKFGREKFGKLVDEYIKSGGKPEALRQEDRQSLYELIKNNPNLTSKIYNLEESLTELSRMAGWDLDARLLEACLDARISIGRLKATKLDDSDGAKDKVTEHIIDIDIHSQLTRSLLMKLAGVTDSD